MNKGHESLLESMEKDATAEKEKLIQSAEEKVAKIKSEAEKQAKNLKEERLIQTEKHLQLERARRLGKQELEIRNTFLKTKHDLIQQTLGKVEAEIKGLRKKKNVYDRIFRAMIKQTVKEFDSAIVIKVGPEDKELCGSLLSEHKKSCRIETSKDVSGGLEMRSEDGRFIVRNNFASRMSKVKEEVIGGIAAVLFK